MTLDYLSAGCITTANISIALRMYQQLINSLFSGQPNVAGITTILILHMGKRKHGQVKLLGQDDPAHKLQIQDSNPGQDL